MRLHFSAKIEIRGINPYVLVSVERATMLRPGWRKPMPVLVQIDGFPTPPWRINMMPVGDGSYYLYLAGPVREASGTSVGDEVTVEVEFDAEYSPVVELPEWFRGSLEGDAAAKANWDKLPPSHQKEVARYLGNLKTTEAQERNRVKTLDILRTGKGFWR